MHSKGNLKEFEIVGCRKSVVAPGSESNESNPLFRYKVFASDQVKARSLFNKTMHTALKLKKINTEIVSIKEVYEANKECQGRNYGIFAVVRQLKSSRVHKIYTEVRDISRCDAVRKFIDSTCGQYNIDNNQINICRVELISDPANLKKNSTMAFQSKTCAFPKIAKTSTLSDRKFKGFMSFKPAIRR